MNLFTAGQAARMQALFFGGARASLLNSDGCAPPCDVACGCTDDTACNFDPNALNDDGTCTSAAMAARMPPPATTIPAPPSTMAPVWPADRRPSP